MKILSNKGLLKFAKEHKLKVSFVPLEVE